jgi:hypothetical protein
MKTPAQRVLKLFIGKKMLNLRNGVLSRSRGQGTGNNTLRFAAHPFDFSHGLGAVNFAGNSLSVLQQRQNAITSILTLQGD